MSQRLNHHHRHRPSLQVESLAAGAGLWQLSAVWEGDDRGWDGWMASPSQWTQVWANSGRQWNTGKPGMLQSIGSQRVRHNWVTEQQQISIKYAGKKGGRTTPKMKINFIRKSPNPLLQNLAARCALAFRIVWLLPYHEYYIAPPTLLSSTQ